MSVIGSNILAGASGQAGYNLTKSLRFRSSASAYLNRTPASASNRKTWTWSAWVKKANPAASGLLFAARTGGGGTYLTVVLSSLGDFRMESNSETAYPLYKTNALFRDPAAWYHIVVALDMTQATSTNRLKVYVNGVLQTTASYNVPAQNTDLAVNSTETHLIGQQASGSYFDGYLTEVNFIDGQALTPSSFGETSTTTGVWIPKKYTGTYGTNGFYLDFEDTSSTAALGYDAAGSNDFTVNNISLTAGTTYDSMTDVPTLTSATAANYCVMNPLFVGQATISSGFTGSPNTISDGNLKVSVGASAAQSGSIGTFGVTTGKWYFEVNVGAVSTGADSIGFIQTFNGGNSYNGYRSNGLIYNEASTTSGFATWTAGDTIAMALDCGAGTLACYKNNTLIATISIAGGVVAPMFPLIWIRDTGNSAFYNANFGQRPFTYTPPTGFVALNTFNLPTPTIGATASTTANKYMDATLWTGTGVARNIVNSGSMQPDFVWIKARNQTYDNQVWDSVRGALLKLATNQTAAESSLANSVTGFNSNGIALGDTATVNLNTGTFVGWQWKAGGTAVTNTAGSITSTVSANTTAGFSIVSFTGVPTGAGNSTIGHGLGVAPQFFIIKNRDVVDGWYCYNSNLGNAAYIVLNTTAAQVTGTNLWGTTSPTSSVFTIRNGSLNTTTSQNLVAYCFAPIAGYSAFGSYTGNGSTDGPFIFTGFRPRFIMFKRTNAAEDWSIWDSSRSPSNLASVLIRPNSSDTEDGSVAGIDLLSNGFKWQNTWTATNGSGSTYIYMAFAEVPLKFSNAR